MLTSLMVACSLEMMGADESGIESTAATVTVTTDASVNSGDRGHPQQKSLITKTFLLPEGINEAEPKERPWLGISTEEASEVLGSQLGLDPGVGLVVTFIATNSPAAQAGLKKNDVLAEFEGQPLVHPAQLRKLVQSRKEGEVVKLTFYRSGKKETVTATLEKTSHQFSWLQDDLNRPAEWLALQQQFRNLPVKDAVREQMKTLRNSLGHLRLDQQRVQEELQRSLEQAKRAYEEALRNAPRAEVHVDALRKALEDLVKARITVNEDAVVTVRSSNESAKSIVKTDDSGTIVIINRPKLHLTAHDKNGKLVFDGEIQTAEGRAQVPRDLWNKVEPLLDKIGSDPDQEHEAPRSPPKETSSGRELDSDREPAL